MINDIPLYKITPEDEGIFTSLNRLDVPWKDSVDPDILDMEYYGNISGNKVISPLVCKNLVYGVLTVTKQRKIADLIFSLYGLNWTKEWNTLSEQYDPIANYDMTETLTNDETVTEYGKTHTLTDNLTHAKTGTETDAPNVTVATTDTVHGFNSTDPVPTDARTQGTSGNDITTYNTSETDTGTRTGVDSGEDTQTRNYELHRSGNIGVTTTQQLLQSERDLWMWNFFQDVVFPDIDEVLTIPVFSNDEYEITEHGPAGTIEIVENGTFDVTDYASADVDVPNSYTVDDQGKVVWGDILIGQTNRSITENGRYDTTLNNDTVVDVPNSYTVSDEGKVVSNGALVAQSSQNISQNGTYDTTLKNEVVVNVPSGGTIDNSRQYYNGYLLPKLPVTNYSYAAIRRNTQSGYYDLFLTSSAWGVSGIPSDNQHWELNASQALDWYRVPISTAEQATEWAEYQLNYTYSSYFGEDSVRPFIWTNHNVLFISYPTAMPYMKQSDPTPYYNS